MRLEDAVYDPDITIVSLLLSCCYRAMAYIVMTYILMAYMLLAWIVMAYIVMAWSFATGVVHQVLYAVLSAAMQRHYDSLIKA